jgi:ATP/maltotriose-dependent transcriptional regulator MalT
MTLVDRRPQQLPMVGRKSEMAVIEDGFEMAEASRGNVILIAGEAGVGKSRLASEAAFIAHESGWLVLSGHADGVEGSPPYLPFVEALQSFAASPPGKDAARLIGGHAGDLARLLPDLSVGSVSEWAPVSKPVMRLSERYRFFETISSFIVAIAAEQRRGLLFWLEDIHQADESTLLLLEHLSRRIAGARVVIQAVYRDSEPDLSPIAARTVEALIRRGARRIDLRPLDLESTAELLAGLANTKPPAAVVRAVHRETDGIPLYVWELLRSLDAEGRLFDSGGRWCTELQPGEAEVPRGVRRMLARRLDRLSATCRGVLTSAAVLGRRFDYTLLRETSGLEEESLLESLDEATRNQLIEEDSGRLRFSHELLRQALLSELSLPRRQQLHLQAAEAIQQLEDWMPERRVGELAAHFHLAGPLASRALVLEYAIRAGDQAARSLAYEEALRLYDIALATATQESEPATGLAGLHIKRGEVLFSLGRWADARQNFESAVDQVEPEPRAEVLVNLALASTWQPDMPSAKRYSDDAARLVDKLGLAHLTAAVEATQAYCDADTGDLESAIARFGRAASLADPNNPGPYRRALWVYPLILYQMGHHGAAISNAESAIAIARASGDVAELANLVPSLGMALAATGRYREADRVLAEGRRLGEEFQITALAAVSKSAGYHMDVFDLASARAFAEEAHDPERALEHWPYATVSSGIDLVMIAARSGDLTGAERLLKELPRQVGNAQGRHGWLWHLRFAQARAEASLARGDWRTAEEEALESLDRSRASRRPKYEALALETRGKALERLGRKREALADLRRAVEVARPVGDPAMFLRAAAELLTYDGDDSLLAEAYETAERIAAELPDDVVGAFEDAQLVRLVYKLHDLPAKRRRPGGLSPRELEVLQLIALGQSNQQIAEELFLSVRTVERHINHIFAKAGVRSRTQAAAFALREGVVLETNR